MNTYRFFACAVLIGALLHFSFLAEVSASNRAITDAAGRQVEIPQIVEHVICSGPGALRLLTYLESQDKIVAVDDMEKQRPRFDARPYALANPQFKDYPIFGEFRGHDHPERILTLDPLPQVIFKTYSAMGHDPVELSKKTGIPVIVLNYGNLGRHRNAMFQSLRIMGEALDKRERAENVIVFFRWSDRRSSKPYGGHPGPQAPWLFCRRHRLPRSPWFSVDGTHLSALCLRQCPQSGP